MNYAISTPNNYTLIPSASSNSDLRDRFIALFLAAGWTAVGSVTNGTRLRGISPQGYLVNLDIFTQTPGGHDPGVMFQLNSAVGSGAVGYSHFIVYLSYASWQVIVHPCGAAISPPGKDYVPGALGPAGSSVFLGIPFIAGNCGVHGAPVTEAWFSFGDTDLSIFFASCPRLNIDVGDGASGLRALSNLACLNGVLSLFSQSNYWNQSEIVRFSCADHDGGAISRPLWYGDTEFRYPPFIAWPQVANGPIQIMGQIYNAFISSATTAPDLTRTLDGYTWMNYTANYLYGGLWHMLAALPVVSGVANAHF